MSATEILEELRRMPEAERRELVEEIGLEFGSFNDEPTPEQIAEFERRGEELRRNPASGIPWEQVRAELKDRIKDRSCAAK
jgi:putative addiction module component (TIGR02574 family)